QPAVGSRLGAPTGGDPFGQPGGGVRRRPPDGTASVSLLTTPGPEPQADPGGRLPNYLGSERVLSVGACVGATCFATHVATSARFPRAIPARVEAGAPPLFGCTDSIGRHGHYGAHRLRPASRSISRRCSRSAITWRFSYCRRPLASPSSSLASPWLKYTRSGISASPRSAVLPTRRWISPRWSSNLRGRTGS